MSAGGLAPEDIIAAAGFVGVVVVALGYQAIRSAVADSPRARMRQRLLDSVSEVAPAIAAGVAEDAAAVMQRRKRLGEDTWAARALSAAKEQAEHMGGVAALRWIVAGALLVATLVVAGLLWLGQSVWLAAAGGMVGGAIGAGIAFRVVVTRYRTRFLQGFPDALDLMIRAVRAGVPVVQAIIAAGRELPDPVGREFRMMGDSLRLGMDAQEVMEQASKRIGVPDFRFFVVCLQLQRETGGPLADTLENLSAIIRSRREVRLKTRALTAQGRAAAKIIALVPFVVMGALNFLGGDYMEVLFHTQRGQRILWLALGLVFTGLLVINRMSKLED
ncbi:type II secretion system F family protein [Magnetospirillum aberrantis]|uniref:Pilus assembly protein n=1 Tax=Magnetospirillum aberrantis SpK TaxID=908842 RepID=A0A7C9UZI0_9PROT|nr:type II secretion system F family protein [Magnetospirillum aberrantis]NFV80735.1 pilus assembly protein [Magnetospirillum aberrantis SpK]